MNKIEHLLACLVEECAEVQQEAGKALRFGLNDKWKDKPTPAEGIAYEFCDLFAVYELLQAEGVIPKLDMSLLMQRKKERVHKYMEYAKAKGSLEQNLNKGESDDEKKIERKNLQGL